MQGESLGGYATSHVVAEVVVEVLRTPAGHDQVSGAQSVVHNGPGCRALPSYDDVMEARGGVVEQLPDRPGSLNQLKKLGDAIRDADAAAYGSLHYNEVWSWCNDLVAATVRDITDLDFASGLEKPATASVTGRAKIRATVREKLQRRHSDKLPSIQDLAGVRVEADMTLTEQDRVVDAIRRRFRQGVEAVHDLRDGSHSGYRGVHLWVRLDAPRGAWFEVQVRTLLQGRWANMYEALADVLGREIRYGGLPASDGDRAIVEQIQLLSTRHIAAIETVHDIAEAAERSGTIDRQTLTPALVSLGFPPEEAEAQAAQAFISDGLDLTAVTRDTVEQVSTLLTEMEVHVRSLSQRKGE